MYGLNTHHPLFMLFTTDITVPLNVGGPGMRYIWDDNNYIAHERADTTWISKTTSMPIMPTLGGYGHALINQLYCYLYGHAGCAAVL